MTRIFKVVYNVDETYDGKNATEFINQTKRVTAKNALDAIQKTWAIIQKPQTVTDPDSKKKIKLGLKNFDPISATLEAEAE